MNPQQAQAAVEAARKDDRNYQGGGPRAAGAKDALVGATSATPKPASDSSAAFPDQPGGSAEASPAGPSSPDATGVA